MRVSFEPDDGSPYVLVTGTGKRSIPDWPIYGIADTEDDALYHDDELDRGTVDDIVERDSRIAATTKER